MKNLCVECEKYFKMTDELVRVRGLEKIKGVWTMLCVCPACESLKVKK